MSTQFKLSRRDLLLSLPALSVARAVFAQSGTKFKIRALNHMTIAVTDPKRTIDFYQTLFGMPIQAHQGAGTTVLRIGPGPQFMAVGSVGAGSIFALRKSMLEQQAAAETLQAALDTSAADMQTLVTTRGRDFPLARLASRLRCPNCGDQTLHVLFDVPGAAIPMFVPQVGRRG